MPWPFLYNAQALLSFERSLFETCIAHSTVNFVQREAQIFMPEKWPYKKPVSVGLVEMKSNATDATSERPVLFLHGLWAGLGCYWKNLAPITAALGGNRRILAIDFLGAGRSSHHMPVWDDGRDSTSAELTAMLVDQLDQFCEVEGIGDLDIVAHSTGAAIATRFCAKHAGRCKNLVLVSPFGLVAAPPGKQSGIRPQGYTPYVFEFLSKHTSPPQAVRAAGPAGFNLARYGMLKRCGHFLEKAEIETLSAYMHRNWVAGGAWGGPGVYERMLNDAVTLDHVWPLEEGGSFRRPHLIDDVEDIFGTLNVTKLTVLFGSERKDWMCNEKVMSVLKNKSPTAPGGVTVINCEEGGHLVYMESADELNKHIIAALS